MIVFLLTLIFVLLCLANMDAFMALVSFCMWLFSIMLTVVVVAILVGVAIHMS